MLNGRASFSPRPREPAQQVTVPAGVSRPTVWRCQQRYAEAEVEGRLRDKTRKPGKARIAAEVRARAVALNCPRRRVGPPIGRPSDGQGDRHFAALSATDRQAYQLQPHRIRTVKSSRDLSFATTLANITSFMSITRSTPSCSRLPKKSDPSSRPNPARFTDPGAASS
jgi:hypothetical protein